MDNFLYGLLIGFLLLIVLNQIPRFFVRLNSCVLEFDGEKYRVIKSIFFNEVSVYEYNYSYELLFECDINVWIETVSDSNYMDFAKRELTRFKEAKNARK